MYEPKGGGKPDYEPPAEPQQYGKPPTEQPPYEKPPVEEPPDDKPPGGDCKCDEWKLEPCPGENEPFRRLLLKLEEELETLAKEPTEATNKFPDDLKDADKEYKGIVALVTKYKEFFDKLDCKLAEAASWKDDIANWLVGKLSDAEKKAIANSRRTNYDEIENERCCEWIRVRDGLIRRLDCLEQAKKKEEEAKENYEAIKGLEKTLTDRFAELKTLFERAKGLRDEERFKALYAVALEFNDVYENLSRIRDWFYARKQCDIKVSEPGSCPTSPSPLPSGDLKKDWSPDTFRTELARRLRLLILAKFQRFRWHHAFLTQDSDNKKKKEACEKFRSDRRDQFIQEAEDVMPPKPSGGGGEPGQSPGQQQPGQYPSTGGYQPPPQTGGYQQSPPPTGGYEQPPQGGYETPPKGGYETPPAGGYQQTQPPSAYEQPSGGYQQRPPGGGPTEPTEPYKGKKK